MKYSLANKKIYNYYYILYLFLIWLASLGPKVDILLGTKCLSIIENSLLLSMFIIRSTNIPIRYDTYGLPCWSMYMFWTAYHIGLSCSHSYPIRILQLNPVFVLPLLLMYDCL